MENPELRNPDGTFRKGQSPNPGGQSAWRKEARKALQERLLPAATRHLERVLTGKRPPDATEAEDALFSELTVKDVNDAAKLVYEYTLPKPRQQVGMKHSGPAGQPLAISIDLGAEKP